MPPDPPFFWKRIWIWTAIGSSIAIGRAVGLALSDVGGPVWLYGGFEGLAFSVVIAVVEGRRARRYCRARSTRAVP